MNEIYADTFERATILEILKEDETGQTLLLKRADDSEFTLENTQKPLKENQEVVLQTMRFDDVQRTTIFEPYRLDAIIWLAVIVVVIALLAAGRRGLSALVGLGVSLGLIAYWILPALVTSSHTLAITLVGAVLLSVVTMTVAHGWNRKTALALTSTLLTLGIAFLLGNLAIKAGHLFGMGSEWAVNLTLGGFPQLDLKGLLLGAILISTVGILDDITISQTAIIHELHETNPRLKPRELFQKSLNVGREHIASLINTLVIVYFGTALPLFLLIANSENPLWVILNNEPLAEEIVRTLVGSFALILAVPISSAISAFAPKRPAPSPSKARHT